MTLNDIIEELQKISKEYNNCEARVDILLHINKEDTKLLDFGYDSTNEIQPKINTHPIKKLKRRVYK